MLPQEKSFALLPGWLRVGAEKALVRNREHEAAVHEKAFPKAFLKDSVVIEGEPKLLQLRVHKARGAFSSASDCLSRQLSVLALPGKNPYRSWPVTWAFDA